MCLASKRHEVQWVQGVEGILGGGSTSSEKKRGNRVQKD